MTKRMSVLLVVTFVGLLALGAWAAIGAKREREHADKAVNTLKDFCMRTKMAIQSDEWDLAGNDPRRQQQALNRFYGSGMMWHSKDSIAMCMDNVPKDEDDCWVRADVKCLDALAKNILKSLP